MESPPLAVEQSDEDSEFEDNTPIKDDKGKQKKKSESSSDADNSDNDSDEDSSSEEVVVIASTTHDLPIPKATSASSARAKTTPKSLPIKQEPSSSQMSTRGSARRSKQMEISLPKKVKMRLGSPEVPITPKVSRVSKATKTPSLKKGKQKKL